MKYFIISDIHSHYDAMKTALDTKGFNINNENHHLIVIGDLFDRGTQPKEVIEFLYPLCLQEKATVLLGNHDVFLLDFLQGEHSRAFFNIHFNSFGKTLEKLSGILPLEENMVEIQSVIEKEYSFLQNWIESFPLYLELGEYIFVHGGIDGRLKNWKEMSTRRDFVWGREYELQRIPEKIVVAGHQRVATIRSKEKDYHKLFKDSPEMFDILYQDGKILIDRFVEISKEINVLVLDIET